MRPGIFVSRTREKLGRTCNQIGRTLEPCNITQRVPVFASKNQHDYKCDTDFMQQFNKQVNIKILMF